MAQNRLFLRCLRCRADLTIARLSAGMGHIWSPARVSVEEADVWYQEHSQCVDVSGGDDGVGLKVALYTETDEAICVYLIA